MAADDIVIEHLRPQDHEQRHVLRRQAFGGTDRFDADAPVLPSEQVVAGYRGDTLLGTVVTLDFDFHLAGGAIPCGGVSGVLVAPEARGSRLAQRMNAQALEEMVERGQVVGALYPTTASLYRSVGYEVAGWWRQRAITLDALAPAADGWSWERTGFADPRLPELDTVHAALFDGGIRLDPVQWTGVMHRWAKEDSTNRYAYIGTGPDGSRAALVYAYATSKQAFYDLDVHLLAGTDSAAHAAALAFLGSNGTTVRELRTATPEILLAPIVPHLQRSRVLEDVPFMLRLVDVGGALTTRRYPTAVSGAVELQVLDPVRPDVSGRFSVDGGTGTWEPSEPTSRTVTVTVQDLASLYSGFQSPRALASAGRLDGAGPAHCDLLAAAFAGHTQPDLFF